MITDSSSPAFDALQVGLAINVVGAQSRALLNIMEDMLNEKTLLEDQRLATFNILDDIHASQEELTLRYKELDAIKSLTQKLGLTLELTEVMQHIAESLQTLFPMCTIASVVAPMTSNTDASLPVSVWTPDVVGPRYLAVIRDSLQLGLSTIPSLQSETADWHRWIENAPVFAFLEGKEDPSLETVPQSQINVPIVVPGAVAGIIHLSALEKGVFEAKNIAIAHTIVGSAAQTIQRLKLLIASEHSRLQDLVESMSNGVVMFDANQQIIVLNPMARDIFKKVQGDLQLEYILQTLRQGKIAGKDENDVQEIYDKAIQQGRTQKIDSLQLDRYFYEVIFTPVRDLQKSIAGGAIILHDITHIQEVDRMKTEFVSLASHQLRTPLTAIRWILERIRKVRGTASTPEERELMDDMQTSIVRMNTLIAELLNVTRLEQGRLTITSVPTDIIAITEKIIEGEKHKMQEKNLTFSLKKPKTFPTVMADANLVQEIFANLLSNAIKYTPDKGTVTIAIEHGDAYWTWSIHDTGIGIPVQCQQKIFEKFCRADNAKAFAPDGNGLGLYLVKLIVQQSKGDVSLVSEEGKGATFTVRLPIVIEGVKGEKSLEKHRNL